MLNLNYILLSICLILHFEICNAKKIAVVYNQSSSGTESSNPDFEQTKSTIEWSIAKFINPKVIEVKYFDSKDTAIGTFEVIKKINIYNPEMVIGFGHSYQAVLAKKELSKHIKLISPVATSDEILINSNNIYLLSNSNSVQAKKIVHDAKIAQDKSEVILVKINDSLYSSNFIENLINELVLHDIKYIVISINQNDLKNVDSFKKKISILKENSTIIFPCLEYDSGLFLSALSQNYKSFKLIGTDGWGTTGSYIKNIEVSSKQQVSWYTNYHFENNSRGNKEFLKEFTSFFNHTPIDTNAFWYESIKIASLMVISKFDWKSSLKKIDSVTELQKIKNQSVERKMSRLRLKNKTVVHDGDF